MFCFIFTHKNYILNYILKIALTKILIYPFNLEEKKKIFLKLFIPHLELKKNIEIII